MVFGNIFHQIFCSFSPVDEELPLFDSDAYPVEARVDGFESTLLNGFVGNADRVCVVIMYGHVCLWLSHFHKRSDYWDGVAGIVELDGGFVFGGGGCDIAYNTVDGVDGAVVWWWFGC
jgi:hypothetical protein